MSAFTKHCIGVVLTFAAIAMAAAWLGRPENGLMVFLSLLSVWLLVHLWQINALMAWLERPKPRNIPKGFGIWQHIFLTLSEHAKSRKRRKQKIIASLQRLYNAFEVMPDGVMILNQEGGLQWLNSVARNHFGIANEQFGQLLSDWVKDDGLTAFLQQHHEQQTMTVRLPLSNGLQRILVLKCSEFDKDLRLLISQDITELEKAQQMRTDFIANVSHELRTPLTVINGFVETLQEHENLPTDKRQQFLQLMQKDSSRMLHLLEDLLTLSRLENHHQQPSMQAVDLSALVTQLVEQGRALSNGKHTLQIEIETNVWIEGIALDLYNALSNLLFNAIRYTQEGGHIQVRLHQENTQAHFSVRDNGPGIAAEHLPRLTERFYRVDTGRSRDSGGTGLGLAITKHALATHQSQLHVTSVLGEGSCFAAVFNTITPVTSVSLTGHTPNP